MKLSHFFICGMASVIFVCASLLAADFQSEMPSTNVPRFIVKPAPDISDTFLAWDGNMKKTNMVVLEETAHYTFNFTNVSPYNVTISNIFPTCSCTTIQSPQLPWTIAPGNHGQIGVTLNLSNKSGTFFKTIL